MKTTKLSHRQVANELEISPAYLSHMVNGKRPWRLDLLERYETIMSRNRELATVAQSGRAPAWGVGGRPRIRRPHVTMLG